MLVCRFTRVFWKSANAKLPNSESDRGWEELNPQYSPRIAPMSTTWLPPVPIHHNSVHRHRPWPHFMTYIRGSLTSNTDLPELLQLCCCNLFRVPFILPIFMFWFNPTEFHAISSFGLYFFRYGNLLSKLLSFKWDDSVRMVWLCWFNRHVFWFSVVRSYLLQVFWSWYALVLRNWMISQNYSPFWSYWFISKTL